MAPPLFTSCEHGSAQNNSLTQEFRTMDVSEMKADRFSGEFSTTAEPDTFMTYTARTNQFY